MKSEDEVSIAVVNVSAKERRAEVLRRMDNLETIRLAEERKAMLKDIVCSVISAEDPPTTYYGSEETAESYSKWAKRCVKMANAVLKEIEKQG